jgi:hypothetical protein
MSGVVTAVGRNPKHTFAKPNQDSIRLLTGLGVEGDAHLGETVKHRSRVARNPHQPNLRQVHLIHAELHDELRTAGFDVSAGQMVEVTGLRNPCVQLDGIQPGLMAAVLGRDEHGNLIRKAGIMGIVLVDGEVRPGDSINVELPEEPHRPLQQV